MCQVKLALIWPVFLTCLASHQCLISANFFFLSFLYFIFPIFDFDKTKMYFVTEILIFSWKMTSQPTCVGTFYCLAYVLFLYLSVCLFYMYMYFISYRKYIRVIVFKCDPSTCIFFHCSQVFKFLRKSGLVHFDKCISYFLLMNYMLCFLCLAWAFS